MGSHRLVLERVHAEWNWGTRKPEKIALSEALPNTMCVWLHPLNVAGDLPSPSSLFPIHIYPRWSPLSPIERTPYKNKAQTSKKQNQKKIEKKKSAGYANEWQKPIVANTSKHKILFNPPGSVRHIGGRGSSSDSSVRVYPRRRCRCRPPFLRPAASRRAFTGWVYIYLYVFRSSVLLSYLLLGTSEQQRTTYWYYKYWWGPPGNPALCATANL